MKEIGPTEGGARVPSLPPHWIHQWSNQFCWSVDGCLQECLIFIVYSVDLMLHYCQVEDVHKRTKLKEDTLEPYLGCNSFELSSLFTAKFGGVVTH